MKCYNASGFPSHLDHCLGGFKVFYKTDLLFSSTNTPRAAALKKNSGSGFNFRLEERAEKRKEVSYLLYVIYFFQKISCHTK